MADETKAREAGPLEEAFMTGERGALQRTICAVDDHERRLNEAQNEHLALAERVARTEDLHRIVAAIPARVARLEAEQHPGAEHLQPIRQRLERLEEHDHGGEVLTAPEPHVSYGLGSVLRIRTSGADQKYVISGKADAPGSYGLIWLGSMQAAKGETDVKAGEVFEGHEGGNDGADQRGTGDGETAEAVERSQPRAHEVRRGSNVASADGEPSHISHSNHAERGAVVPGGAQGGALPDLLLGWTLVRSFLAWQATKPDKEAITAWRRSDLIAEINRREGWGPSDGSAPVPTEAPSAGDPAGDVAALTLVRDQNKMLEAEVARLKALPEQVSIQRVPVAPDEIVLIERDGDHRAPARLAPVRADSVPWYLATDDPGLGTRPIDEPEVARLEAMRDSAYDERNRVVAALARVVLAQGGAAGIRRHEPDPDPDWDDDWKNVVAIDLPTGQVTWHYHDSHRALFEGLPAYTKDWDGHTTDEKYRRLGRLRAGPPPEALPEPTGDLTKQEIDELMMPDPDDRTPGTQAPPNTPEGYWIAMAEKIRENAKLEADLAEARKERDEAREQCAKTLDAGRGARKDTARLRKVEGWARQGEVVITRADEDELPWRIDAPDSIHHHRAHTTQRRLRLHRTFNEALDALPEPPWAGETGGDAAQERGNSPS